MAAGSDAKAFALRTPDHLRRSADECTRCRRWSCLAGGEARVLSKNFSGYPSRIVRGAGGHYWLAFFALRTQLTEFVLREHAFRARMMANFPPHLWVGPTLGGAFDCRGPTRV